MSARAGFQLTKYRLSWGALSMNVVKSQKLLQSRCGHEFHSHGVFMQQAISEITYFW